MGFLLALGVEITRAIKNRKRDPDYDHVYNTTLYREDKEDFLFRIDYFLRLKNKLSAEEFIEMYLETHNKDEEISRRIELLNNL
jgi:hypothetical protein